MDTVAAMFAFFSPLPIPVITCAVLLAVVVSAWKTPLFVLIGGVVALPLLTIVLGPMLISSSSGPFVVPWWASSLGSGTFFVWQYSLACAAVLLLAFSASLVASHRRNP